MDAGPARDIARHLSNRGYITSVSPLRAPHLEWLLSRGKAVTELDVTVDVQGGESHTVAWEIGRMGETFQGVFTHNNTTHRFY